MLNRVAPRDRLRHRAPLTAEAECSEILHTIAACRRHNSLMAEVLEGHVRFHVVDPDPPSTSPQALAAQEFIDVIKQYVR